MDFNFAEKYLHAETSVKTGPIQHRFSPYTDNGGTVLAIAGKDYCIIAGDTRQSEGYSINARYAPKVHALHSRAVLAAQGMAADANTLVGQINQRQIWYEHKHGKSMSVSATAQMLSTILYGKRFFPYSVWNVLGGVDENGEGAVFAYDPVGNYRRCGFKAGGSAAALVQPFLDSQVGFKHQPGKEGTLSLEEAIRVARDAFTSATERDIYTGDFLEIFVVKKEGTEKLRFDLKRD